MSASKAKAPDVMLSTLPSISIDTSALGEGRTPSSGIIANRGKHQKRFAAIHDTKRQSKKMGGRAVTSVMRR